MAFTTIPTRTSADTAIPYQDINSLMANTQYFKDAITVSSGNVGIGGAPISNIKTLSRNDIDSRSFASFRGSNTVGHGSGLFFGLGDSVSASTFREYGAILGTIVDNTSGSHGGCIDFYCSSSGSLVKNMTIDSLGNIGIMTSTFGTSAAGVLAIKNGTVPSTSPADTLQIFAVDLSAGNSTLGIRTETAVTTAAAGASDRYLNIKINGTTYKLLLHS